MQPALEAYIATITHEWSKTLAVLGLTLIPLFFILDYFMMPPELLTRFAAYRLVTTAIVTGQYLVIRYSEPSPRSLWHGYFFSFVAASMIALMTTDLAGFNSTYYAGLNLVIIAANLTLPWKALHSAINSALIVGIYVALNLLFPNPEPVKRDCLLNNLYFLVATAIISVAISWLKQQLIRGEFSTRADLQDTRDALWGEMEVAKRIQTSLLPKEQRLVGYGVAATMLPADKVGGDYYDLIETRAGETWLSIGDVSGHGVESGLIMMMTQTSIATAVNGASGLKPSQVLNVVNTVLTENIARLGADRYMTLALAVLDGRRMVFAGRHQDILVYRRRSGRVEEVATNGTWLGVVDDLESQDTAIEIDDGDVILLFTDGVTEATNHAGEMFGEEKLEQALGSYATLDADEIVRNIVRDVRDYMDEQRDDITLVAFKRVARAAQAARRSWL